MGKYYTRLGQCHSCGQCCSNVHLAFGGITIKNAQVLAEVQKTSAEYRYFRAVRQTEAGIFVGCIHLMPNKKCAIYEHRPRFCREYPSEFGILAGAELAPNCGYTFRPNIAFQTVLKKLVQS
jgi:Fe-S-cluster containining protein